MNFFIYLITTLLLALVLPAQAWQNQAILRVNALDINGVLIDSAFVYIKKGKSNQLEFSSPSAPGTTLSGREIETKNKFTMKKLGMRLLEIQNLGFSKQNGGKFALRIFKKRMASNKNQNFTPMHLSLNPNSKTWQISTQGKPVMGLDIRINQAMSLTTDGYYKLKDMSLFDIFKIKVQSYNVTTLNCENSLLYLNNTGNIQNVVNLKCKNINEILSSYAGFYLLNIYNSITSNDELGIPISKDNLFKILKIAEINPTVRKAILKKAVRNGNLFVINQLLKKYPSLIDSASEVVPLACGNIIQENYNYATGEFYIQSNHAENVLSSLVSSGASLQDNDCSSGLLSRGITFYYDDSTISGLGTLVDTGIEKLKINFSSQQSSNIFSNLFIRIYVANILSDDDLESDADDNFSQRAPALLIFQKLIANGLNIKTKELIKKINNQDFFSDELKAAAIKDLELLKKAQR